MQISKSNFAVYSLCIGIVSFLLAWFISNLRPRIMQIPRFPTSPQSTPTTSTTAATTTPPANETTATPAPSDAVAAGLGIPTERGRVPMTADSLMNGFMAASRTRYDAPPERELRGTKNLGAYTSPINLVDSGSQNRVKPPGQATSMPMSLPSHL